MTAAANAPRSTATEQAISQDVRQRRKPLQAILPDELATDVLLFESLDAILSIEFWISLRQDQQLDLSRARRVLHYAVGRLAAQASMEQFFWRYRLPGRRAGIRCGPPAR